MFFALRKNPSNKCKDSQFKNKFKNKIIYIAGGVYNEQNNKNKRKKQKKLLQHVDRPANRQARRQPGKQRDR